MYIWFMSLHWRNSKATCNLFHCECFSGRTLGIHYSASNLIYRLINMGYTDSTSLPHRSFLVILIVCLWRKHCYLALIVIFIFCVPPMKLIQISNQLSSNSQFSSSFPADGFATIMPNANAVGIFLASNFYEAQFCLLFTHALACLFASFVLQII